MHTEIPTYACVQFLIFILFLLLFLATQLSVRIWKDFLRILFFTRRFIRRFDSHSFPRGNLWLFGHQSETWLRRCIWNYYNRQLWWNIYRFLSLSSGNSNTHIVKFQSWYVPELQLEANEFRALRLVGKGTGVEGVTSKSGTFGTGTASETVIFPNIGTTPAKMYKKINLTNSKYGRHWKNNCTERFKIY